MSYVGGPGEAVFQVCRSVYPDAPATGWCCAVMVRTAAHGYGRKWLAKAIGVDVTLLAQESDKPLLEEVMLTRSMVKRGRRDP